MVEKNTESPAATAPAAQPSATTQPQATEKAPAVKGRFESMMSEQIDKLAEALSVAQGKITPPVKDKTGKIEGVNAAGKEYSYNYKYADLDSLVNAIREPLAASGLAHSQIIFPGPANSTVDLLFTFLFHKSGQWLRSVYELPKKGTMLGKRQVTDQIYGGSITYGRRYSLSALTGVASEEDDDANRTSSQEGSAKGGGQQKPPTDPKLMRVPKFAKVHGEKLITEVPIDDLADLADWCLWKKRDKDFTDACFAVIPDFAKEIEKSKQRAKEKAAAKGAAKK
jgi:hypothetical protein